MKRESVKPDVRRTERVGLPGVFIVVALVAISWSNRADGVDASCSESAPRQADRAKLAGNTRESVGPVAAVAGGTRFISFSLKEAQRRIKQVGRNWRQRDPNVADLGGMNQVLGFVVDTPTGDLVLVGQGDNGPAALTLDDFVVSLRARRCCGRFPSVTICPTPHTAETGLQHVGFDGGIENTTVGQALFDAALRLGELSLGLREPGIWGFSSAWDRERERLARRVISEPRRDASHFVLVSTSSLVSCGRTYA